MSEPQSIKDTLNIIRKALEDKEPSSIDNDNDVLILNKLINDDGTIQVLENKFLKEDEIKEILDQKISKYFKNHFKDWLDKNIPNYIDKHFNKK